MEKELKLKNTDLHVLMFLSSATGCFFTVWVTIALNWNEIQTDISGKLFSGPWYIIPFVLAALMTICVTVGTINVYLAIMKGGVKECKLVKK